jgi:beta-glucosidase
VAVQPNTVVVLTHGGVLRLAPVDGIVPAILDGTLLGEAGGGAIADVLFGAVNPSGKLTETVPVRLEDAPSFLNYPGENLRVLYGEGIFVGYRGYDRRRLDVSFPFGHGLSYTSFDYTDLEVEVTDEGIEATLAVTNSGKRDGRETVQLYIQGPGTVLRPFRELKAFNTVFLRSGQTERVKLTVSRADLSYWETRTHGWVLESGNFTVDVGSSSRDIRTSAVVHLDGDELALPLTADSSIGELMNNPATAATMKRILTASEGDGPGSAAADELGIDAAATVAGIPIGRLRALSGGRGPSKVQLTALLANANQAVK